ncbi:MAG: Rieske 2Fe-2S domain-containing protein [Bernardetiaceae bacterium]|nr:Rieske 2Fe-2S domain-containing protein [Bernardetiaceae bacterium]
MNWYPIFESREAAIKATPLGKTTLVRAAHLRICLAHTDSGFFAVADACPHAGASLQGGFINEDNEIVCPLHAYRFSLKDGSLKSGGRCPDIKTYPLEWRDGALHIGLPF